MFRAPADDYSLRERTWQVAKRVVESSNQFRDDLLPVCAAFTLWIQLFSGCGVTVQLAFWLDGEVQCVGLSL
jgi:hypothetical protein